jgi:hypothetical protein
MHHTPTRMAARPAAPAGGATTTPTATLFGRAQSAAGGAVRRPIVRGAGPESYAVRRARRPDVGGARSSLRTTGIGRRARAHA